MLEGHPFILFTVHKPLTLALHKVADPWNARQSPHLAYMAEFTADIQYVPGTKNVVADTLSRPLVSPRRPHATRPYPRRPGHNPAA